MPHRTLTNLLPPERKKAIKRIYLFRLVTVCILVLSFIVLSSAAILVPSYIHVHQQNILQTKELERLSTTLIASGGKDVALRIKTLAQDAGYLSRLATSSTATSVITLLTNIPHQGISITGISYTPVVKGVDGKVILNGTATTRTTLRSYMDALSSQPFIKNADLPISAYAKEKEIPFTITLTGTFTP